MKVFTTHQFDSDYDRLPQEIKERADKKLALFMSDLRHPSLRAKKMEGYPSIWEGRISRNYRFTFQIEKDTALLRRIGTHDILKTP